MATTATNLTREHYQRPEVREVILRFCQEGEAWRALNGDTGWYISTSNDEVRLRTPEDYANTTARFRTLYATLDLLATSVRQVSRAWDEKKGAPIDPIGTLQDCLAYTLGVDIDGIGDIRNDLTVKAAVEDAAKFLVTRLKEVGVCKSVYCLFSGGGIYVLLHHNLFRTRGEWGPEEREQAFRSLTGAYNLWLGDVEASFSKAHPEHVGRVKFDKLNNQKRKFKVIFSIHKKLPLVVIPLDPLDVRIDFERARLPLSTEVLQEGEQWYRDYDFGELAGVQELLAPFVEQVEEELRERKARAGSYEISQRSEPLPVEAWPPCMRNILEHVTPGKGPHRALAILASFLYQAGWAEEEAFKLWEPLADRAGVEPRIFDQWYGLMSCPNCATIQKTSAGYPRVGLGGFGYCQHDGECGASKWPGEYNKEKERGQGAEEQRKDEGTVISEEELQSLSVAENPRLEVRLESDNAIKRYIEYGKSTSDAYPEYHYGAALSLLSIATRRNLVLRLAQGDVCPNIWAFMLGRSTISRKTAAILKALRFANDLFPYTALPQSYSPEGLIEELSENPRGYLFKDEAGGMLSAMSKNYMLEMRDLYCVLYDCPESYRRKLRSSQRKARTQFEIQNAFVNIVTATTPEVFREHTTLLDLTSGWLLRFLYFHPNYKKDWMAFKQMKEEDFVMYGKVLGRISQVKGMFWGREDPLEITLEPAAWSYYQTWQEHRETELQESADAIELALWGRLAVYALKLAMLFTVARADYHEGTQISLAHIQESCRQIDEYFLPVGRLVAEEVAREETVNLQNKILGSLSRAGGKLKRRDLLKKLHVKLKDVDEALDALEESDEVVRFDTQGLGGTTSWVLLKQLNTKEANCVKPKTEAATKVSTLSKMSMCLRCRNNSDECTCIHGTDATLATPGTGATPSTPGTDESEPEPSVIFDDGSYNWPMLDAKIKAAVAEGITDPLKLAEVVGLPVCIVARHAGNYAGIDLQKAGEILVQIGRAGLVSGRNSDPGKPLSLTAELQEAEQRREHEEGRKNRKAPQRFGLIYRPAREALEYSNWGMNLVESGKPRGPKVRSCSHGCKYCYNGCGQENLLPGPTVKSNLLEKLNQELPRVKTYLNPGECVHLTFVGDLYDQELPRELPRRILELFKAHGVPFQILTKRPDLALRDLDLYFDGCRFGTTLTFDNEQDSRAWEPGACLPAGRIDSLKIAHNRGIATWVSLEPVIDPTQTLSLIAAAAGFVDFFGLGKLNHDHPRENSINWPKFRREAEALLQKFGKRYMVKKALSAAAIDSEKPASAAGEEEAELCLATRQKAEQFKTPVYCAVCGADLTGKGQIEKGGKIYCLQPGCGYPAREAKP